MEKSMSQRLVAEFVGTLTLVFVAAGAIIAADRGGAGAGLVTIAIAYGLAVATMVSALGHVSGHFNPAVTIGIWIAQRIKTSDAVAYVGAQLVGATAGALLLRAAFRKEIWQLSNLGTPTVNATQISNGQAVLIEAILAFFLVWVVFGTMVDREGKSGAIAGLTIGLVVVMDAMMGYPFTGSALNPARHFGPAVISGTWDGWWVYWIGPVAGGIVAAAVYDGVILRSKSAPAAAETDVEAVADAE